VLDEYISKYTIETDQNIRNELFQKHIYFSLFKMAENIIYTFNFEYVTKDNNTEEEIYDHLLDAVSHATLQLDKYNNTKGKSFSYFTRIIKNYCILQNSTWQINRKRRVNHIEWELFNDHADLKDETVNPLPIELIIQPVINSDYTFKEIFIQHWNFNSSGLKKKRDIVIFDCIMSMAKGNTIVLDPINKKQVLSKIREVTGYKTVHITKAINKIINNMKVVNCGV
jgi:hypothetical protein